MTNFDGFYVAYMTGALGSSLGMCGFKDGKISGADVGGGKYRGTFTVDNKSSQVHCLLEFIGIPGTQSIGGAAIPPNHQPVQIPLVLPTVIDPKQVFRIETPMGPINVSMEKLQDF